MFMVGIIPVLQGVVQMTPHPEDTQHAAYMDDFYITIPIDDLTHTLEHMQEPLTQAKLEFNPTKTRLWRTAEHRTHQIPPAYAPLEVQELNILGSRVAPRGSNQDDDAQALGGANTALKATTRKTQRQTERLTDLIQHGLDPQTAAALLRYLTMGAPVHIVRTSLPNSTLVEEYDSMVKTAWETSYSASLMQRPGSKPHGNLP